MDQLLLRVSDGACPGRSPLCWHGMAGMARIVAPLVVRGCWGPGPGNARDRRTQRAVYGHGLRELVVCLLLLACACREAKYKLGAPAIEASQFDSKLRHTRCKWSEEYHKLNKERNRAYARKSREKAKLPENAAWRERERARLAAIHVERKATPGFLEHKNELLF